MVFECQQLPFFEPDSLFKQYIQNNRSVTDFFQFTVDEWESCLSERGQHSFPRSALVDILLKQNKNWGGGALIDENIRRVKNENTFLIITGQQAGILGGPLYTVYKALSAIKVSQVLQQKYPDYHFLPLFWMEVGDNDYAEVNHFKILDIKNELQLLSLPAEAEDRRSVGLRSLPEEMNALISELADLLPDTEFKDDELAAASEFYAEGKGFADAFAAWLLHYVGKYGLIIFNPTDREFKKLARPYFEKAITHAPQINQILIDAATTVAGAGFKPQVAPRDNQTLLFMEDMEQARCRLDLTSDGFEMRNGKGFTDKLFTSDELIEQIAQNSEKFSPNVFFRPILQDAIFPSAAYIGGPGEIGYLAQLKNLYSFFDVPQPIFLPRTRLTLIEKKVDKWVRKFGLNYPKIYQQKTNLIKNYIAGHSENRLSGLFLDIEKQFSHIFKKINVELKEVDPQLQSAIDKTEAQCSKSVQNLKQRSDKALERKMDAEVKQLKNLLQNLFPADNFQERELNLIYFTAKYGAAFVDALYEIFPVFDDHHQLIFI